MTPLTEVKKNIIANFAGRIWAGLISIIFVPLYIKFMGIESYGLIGIFMALMALLSILDLGLSSTLSRELARLSVGKGSEQESRDLVRTLEVVYWGTGIFLGFVLAASAPFIARHWIQPRGITEGFVEKAFLIMGIVAASQWPASLYSGGLMGLQKQVLLNWIRAGIATAQAGGAVLVLWWISPTILAYFVWQIFTNILQTALLARYLWGALPKTGKKAEFRKHLFEKNWKFAAGMTGISVLATILTQVDKIVLSKFLSLEYFGYYALAFNVSNTLNQFVTPFFVALFPRFSQMVAGQDYSGLSSVYHKGCQLVSAVILPAAITLAFFSKEILSLWIGQSETVANTYFLLSLLTAGTTLNCIMTLPYALQLAYGWTRLSFYKNLVAVILLIPFLIWMIKLYGAAGAAIVWIVLNAGYFLVEIPIMHRRLLKTEMWRWYFSDVGLPLSIVISLCLISRVLMPREISANYSIFWILVTASSTFLCSAIALGYRYGRSLKGGLP